MLLEGAAAFGINITGEMLSGVLVSGMGLGGCRAAAGQAAGARHCRAYVCRPQRLFTCPWCSARPPQLYHVSPEHVMTADLTDGEEIPTEAGDSLPLKVGWWPGGPTRQPWPTRQPKHACMWQHAHRASDLAAAPAPPWRAAGPARRWDRQAAGRGQHRHHREARPHGWRRSSAGCVAGAWGRAMHARPRPPHVSLCPCAHAPTSSLLPHPLPSCAAVIDAVLLPLRPGAPVAPAPTPAEPVSGAASTMASVAALAAGLLAAALMM